MIRRWGLGGICVFILGEVERGVIEVGRGKCFGRFLGGKGGVRGDF